MTSRPARGLAASSLSRARVRNRPAVLDNRSVYRSAAAAFLASFALALPACGGTGSPATRTDVEAQVRHELPQQLQENQVMLARLALAYGVVVRFVGTHCTPKENDRFDCTADAVTGNGLGGYRSHTIDVSADCPKSRCTLRVVE